MGLFIVSLVVSIVLFAYPVTMTSLRRKNKLEKLEPINVFIRNLLFFGLGFAASFTVCMISIYEMKIFEPKTNEILSIIFGGFFFALFGFMSLESFIIHYYFHDLPEKLNKWLFRILMIVFPLTIVFIFVLSNGFADYVNGDKAIINGINFKYGWTRASEATRPNLAFYAICIISGALYAYFYGDHKFYKYYGKHGLLESMFYMAFPAGIIGARLFYVIGEWNNTFKHGPFLDVFKIWDGGITILGGAFVGGLVGILWFKFKHKELSTWLMVDTVVPAVLVAQAVGRWGNFFNAEVHGNAVDGSLYSWLPKIVYNQMKFSSDNACLLGTNQIYVPLFLIESLSNLLGFFVMAHLFGIALKKYLEPGDVAMMYPVWYGLTRVIMEPIRHNSYNMGSEGYWSWFWSLAFFAIGLIAIGANHLVRDIVRKKKGTLKVNKGTFKYGLVGSIITIVAAAIFFGVGIYKVTTNSYQPTCNWTPYNFGLTMLAAGIGILAMLMVFVPKIVNGRKYEEQI